MIRYGLVLFKYSNLVVLVLAVVWAVEEPGWEPIVVSFGFLTSYVYQDYKNWPREIPKNDQLMFKKFLEDLPDDNMIRALKRPTFSSVWPDGLFRPLFHFEEEWQKSTRSFKIVKLRKLLTKLLRETSDLTDLLASHTFDKNDRLRMVYPDLKYGTKEKQEYRLGIVDKMNKQSVEFSTAYENLVESGMSLLDTGDLD